MSQFLSPETITSTASSDATFKFEQSYYTYIWEFISQYLSYSFSVLDYFDF